MACSILLTIPVQFGILERVKRIANSIINPQQFVGFQSNSLKQRLIQASTI